MKTFEFFHGGFGLQYPVSTLKPNKKARWEYGPGLYLTSDVTFANNYAKGNRSLFKVVVEKGKSLEMAMLKIEDIEMFFSKNCSKKVTKQLISNITKFVNIEQLVSASIFVNFCIELLPAKYSVKLANFLTENQIDYSLSSSAFNSGLVLVMFNPAKILSVTKLSRKKWDPSLEYSKETLEKLLISFS